MKQFSAIVLGATLGFVVVACGGSSGGAIADNNQAAGVTQAEFDALVARVEALEALGSEDGLTGNVLTASAGSTAVGMQKAAAVSDICSVLSYAPSAQFPGTMETASCKSPTGYLLALPLTTTADTVRPAPLNDRRIFFESVDCTGQPYVSAAQVGDMGIRQGAVFQYYANEPLTGHIEAGSEPIKTLSLISYWGYDDGTDTWSCGSLKAGVWGIPILPNDPEVTGVQDTYVGPITMF